MDVIEFLEARIREDEEAAHRGFFNSVPYPMFEGGPVTQQSAELPPQLRTRVLEECAAKREILLTCILHCTDSGNATLFILARVYKDHPDYRDQWPGPQSSKWDSGSYAA